MTIEEVHKTLDELYAVGTRLESVKDPISWALHQTEVLSRKNIKSEQSNAEITVKNWRINNPSGRKIDCYKETGISRPTINKYWEEETDI